MKSATVMWNTWTAPPQSPDLDIIEHLWCTSEQKVRSYFLQPTFIKEPKQVPLEEWI